MSTACCGVQRRAGAVCWTAAKKAHPSSSRQAFHGYAFENAFVITMLACLLILQSSQAALRLAASACSVAKPGKFPWQNQDAQFVSSTCFGVFDGVSSAPASRAYAEKLASTCKVELAKAKDEPWPAAPKQALARAMKAAKAIRGASTASLLQVDIDRQTISSYNLGDSGFLLFAPPDTSGNQRLCAKSSPMLHGGGSPFQLGGGGEEMFSDSPSDGRAATHPFSSGCVAILHSDGLLDNLSTEEVADIIASKQARDMAGIARALAFAANARKRRPDDVTVIAIAAVGATRTRRRDVVARASSLALVLAAGGDDMFDSPAASAAATVQAVERAQTSQAGSSDPLPPVAVLDLIRVYGRLAGDECFGRRVPKASGASCQLTLDQSTRALGLDISGYEGGLSEEQFISRLRGLAFEWPLKPWGAAGSASNEKTATMNKSAETAVFMAELERRRLYDRRNPTGPLPTSLRPVLNAQIGEEDVDPLAVRACFRALRGDGDGRLTAERLAQTFRKASGGEDVLDYYSFLELVKQATRVFWPAD